ncbi:MAG: MBL fold metallo-hydrolase [Candidatus Kryptoniota bacterium]
MRVGNYDVRALDGGRFRLDGGAMFGIIPKALWSRTNPSDEQNRIELALRVMLIRGEGRVILVDTGIGTKWDSKFREIYAVDQTRNSLQNSLESFGLKPADITDVIITHLHFDHVGGAVSVDKDRKIVPAFSNAVYHIQKRQYEWALKPTEKDQASFIMENFVPIWESGQVNFLDGEVELYPGIFIKLSDGHTIAQQLVIIRGDGVTIFHPGDMIPTSTHVQLPYIMGYDNYPLITLEEKKRYLSRCVDERWVVFFEHDPLVDGAYIERTGKGFRAGHVVSF